MIKTNNVVNGEESYKGSLRMDVKLAYMWKLPLHPINLCRADKRLLSGRRIHSRAVIHVLQLLTQCEDTWPVEHMNWYRDIVNKAHLVCGEVSSWLPSKDVTWKVFLKKHKHTVFKWWGFPPTRGYDSDLLWNSVWKAVKPDQKVHRQVIALVRDSY